MFWFVVGYARVELKGDNLLECLNTIQKSGVELKNVNNMSGRFFADVKTNDIRKVYSICSENGVELAVIGRFGLAMKLYIYKRRTVFLVGILVCICMLFLKSSFISDVRISGNNYLTDNQIMEVLKECGIFPGRFLYSVKPDEVQNEILKKCNRFSWVWVDIKGTVAYVDVREKVSKPEIYDKSYACNIIAEKDGVISEAISESGINYAFPGKYVRKGELMIGGIYDSNEYAPVRFVRAKGIIKAKTFYSLSDCYNNRYTEYTAKKVQTGYSLNFFGFCVGNDIIKGNNKFIANKKEKYISIFGKKFSSLGFTNEQYYEIIKKEYTMNMKETEQRAIRELTERLYASLSPDVQVLNEKSEVVQNEDGTICVTVTFECLEDIGCESRIEITD